MALELSTPQAPIAWHPALFSGPMIRAARREVDPKRETRRVLRVPETEHAIDAWRTDGQGRWHGVSRLATSGGLGVPETEIIACPYGRAGDMLWVRERMRVVQTFTRERVIRVRYEADGEVRTVAYPKRLARPIVGKCLAYGGHREASRMSLVVREIRVERLQAITDEGIRAEGVTIEVAREMLASAEGRKAKNVEIRTLREAWAAGWDAINGKRASWASDPFVWVISFVRVEATHG